MIVCGLKSIFLNHLRQYLSHLQFSYWFNIYYKALKSCFPSNKIQTCFRPPKRTKSPVLSKLYHKTLLCTLTKASLPAKTQKVLSIIVPFNGRYNSITLSCFKQSQLSRTHWIAPLLCFITLYAHTPSP